MPVCILNNFAHTSNLHLQRCEGIHVSKLIPLGSHMKVTTFVFDYASRVKGIVLEQ